MADLFSASDEARRAELRRRGWVCAMRPIGMPSLWIRPDGAVLAEVEAFVQLEAAEREEGKSDG